MDQRLYHYQYRRPRLNNPTYTSNNINNSMTYFVGSPMRNYSVARYQNTTNIPNTDPQLVRPRGSSHLSNYGNNTLKIDQNQIYEKQNNKYDIISFQAKQHQEKLNQYPKLTLQDKDAHYYRKLQINNKQYQQPNYQNHQSINQVAGRHTYVQNLTKLPSQDYNYFPTNKQYFTPKMLNHVDEVSGLM